MPPESPAVPRIAPSAEGGEGLMDLNIFRTLAHHPALHDRFGRFGGYLLYKGLLPARERELVILRVGWRCRSVYEFGQHTVVGRASGLGDEEIRRAATAGTDGWEPRDRDLVDLADELCTTDTVSDGLWARLAERWSEPELLELVVVAGFYRMVSGLLNSVGVQLDEGTPGWPPGAETPDGRA